MMNFKNYLQYAEKALESDYRYNKLIKLFNNIYVINGIIFMLATICDIILSIAINGIYAYWLFAIALLAIISYITIIVIHNIALGFYELKFIDNFIAHLNVNAQLLNKSNDYKGDE